MTVSAIVITHKQIEFTLAALASLEQQTVPIEQVIVVDNDRERSAAAPLRAAHPETIILEEDKTGYAPARKRAHALPPGARRQPRCRHRVGRLAVLPEPRRRGSPRLPRAAAGRGGATPGLWGDHPSGAASERAHQRR